MSSDLTVPRYTRLQWAGFTLYVLSTILALWTSLSELHGWGFLIIILCLPVIAVGLSLMAFGGRREATAPER